MKFTCTRSLLTSAVLNVSRIIPSKSSIPSLEGIQIKAYNSKLLLTGYDMESGITTEIDADIKEEGEIVLSARLFSEMIRKMYGEEVTVSADDKCLTEIKSGISKYTILGIPSADYPELPKIDDENEIKISQPVFKNMIEQTIFAVAVTDAKPVHTGVLFDIDSESFKMIAVDGYRLAFRSEKTDTGNEINFVVPGKILSEISKLLGDNEEEFVKITVSKRYVVFKINEYCVISRLLEGDFLDYKTAIPKGGDTQAEAVTRELIDSIERASLLITDRLRSPLKVIFDEENIKISSQTSVGNFYDEVESVHTGENLEMGFNNRYLLDALKAADTDKIRIVLGGPLSPIKILPPEGEDFLFLVLPVRLKNE